MKKHYVRYYLAAIAVFAIIIWGITLVNHSEPTKKFQVIDQYKNCDVVRYTTPSNTWQYFLHCQ